MSKKKIIYCSLLIILAILSISGVYYFNKEKKNDNKIKSNNNLAIMIKRDGTNSYFSSNSIPVGDYVLNEEKTICENGGKVKSYDSSTGKIGFSFLGSDRCTLYFDALKPLAWKKILNDNGGNNVIVAKGTPDFSKIANDGGGLFRTTDDLGFSYYFRGFVKNNWVKFGKYTSDYVRYRGYDDSNSTSYKEYDTLSECNESDTYNYNCSAYYYGKTVDDIYWRIIRINGDNSIRMIYTGTKAPSNNTLFVMTGDNTSIGFSKYNAEYGNSENVGYKYTNSQQHGYGESSTIKTHLDNWYKITSLETDALTKALIADEIFCNDRNVSTDTWTSSKHTNYAAYVRLNTNKTPSLLCSTFNDRFTVTSETGNKSLSYPVGLITADEVSMAGATYTDANSDYYLYNGASYWTMSPGAYNGLYFYSSVFTILSSLSMSSLVETSGVRPVINLSNEVRFNGNGTVSNIYTIS